MMVTPAFVRGCYLRPFVSNSMTWAWPRPTHNTSARAPAPKSRFMRQFYDTGASRLEKKKMTTADKAAHDRAAADLADRFNRNFEKFSGVSREIAVAAPGM